MNWNSHIETTYLEHYTNSPIFQEAYRVKRLALYSRIISILSELGARRVLDLGCAYGILVELCNMVGIEAYGLDLPIPELQRFHDRLRYSQGKIVYCSLNRDSLPEQLMVQEWDVVVILDTLRYIESYASLTYLKPRYWLIKEVTNNIYMRYRRRHNNLVVKLWSPGDLLELFKGYTLHVIYGTRFAFKATNPSRLSIFLYNAILPAYTAILTRNSK